MQSRREFLKTAALLSGAVGMWATLEESVSKAMAIEPEPASTYLDAEHIVILMQENRSFDHCYGTLRGVRGYNDPRAITLPNNDPVWVQTNAARESYSPFRLNLKDTKSTWMGSLPHDWGSQVDARNRGKFNRWLQAKHSAQKEYASMPLTMGYYNRQDIPFYYALADAFTICDQHFCSSLTPTYPNRLYFWTGTVREKPTVDSPANVRNEQIGHNHWTNWTTFPERLEDNGISWKIYQNELTIPTGLNYEEMNWLGSFGCNVFEYFAQYHVRANPVHRKCLARQRLLIPKQIAEVEKQLTTPNLDKKAAAALKKRMEKLTEALKATEKDWKQSEDFQKLSPREKSLHSKAFCTNIGDPSYRQLATMTYQDGGIKRQVKVPKGDIFHQFREDVKGGALPAVSWLVASEKLSDHPASAWYGAWFVSEALRILTENPEVWKKTIFILTYDENDGYFDHVPPFVAPHPHRPETGFTSKGIDASLDYVELEQDQKLKFSDPRESPIGLGYRVPMVIASPWSRGGCVCSQVMDNTSILQFLEKVLTHKTGRSIKETNISSWRRAICGDLTSLFQPAAEKKERSLDFVERDPFVEQIDQAQFRPIPSGYKALSRQEVEQIRQDPRHSEWMPSQERGVRRSCALPYELYADGSLNEDRARFSIRLAAGNNSFGRRAAGCPFTVYARTGNDVVVRNYAVKAGDHLDDSWAIRDFTNGIYHLQVYGPNGFFREFIGTAEDPSLKIRTGYVLVRPDTHELSGNVEVRAVNRDLHRAFTITITDQSYNADPQKRAVLPDDNVMLSIDTQHSFRWYDFTVGIEQIHNFQWRFAGRVETGQWGFSDPAMGNTPQTLRE